MTSLDGSGEGLQVHRKCGSDMFSLYCKLLKLKSNATNVNDRYFFPLIFHVSFEILSKILHNIAIVQ